MQNCFDHPEDYDDIVAMCHKYDFYQDNIRSNNIVGKKKGHSQEGNLFSLLSSSSLNFVSKEPIIGHIEKEEGSGLKLSTNQLLRLAGKSFIDQKASNESVNHQHALTDSMTPDDKQDFQIALHLLAAAEKISEKQYDEASQLIATYRHLRFASKTGTPVQRLAHYFSEAFEKKIERERTRLGTNVVMEKKIKVEEHTICSDWNYYCSMLSFYQQLPFIQSLQYAATQAILESIKSKSKVHIIDAQMRTGVQWAVLMHAIATKQELYPIEYIKITTLVTTDDRNILESLGRQLKSMSSRILDSVHFSFHIINLLDFVEEERILEEGCADEAVVVYAPFALRSGIVRPKCLEKLMKVVKRMKPTLMVVAEVEANHNTPSFVNRFIESLFYFGAIFDSLEDRMDREDEKRMAVEEIAFRCGIENVVAPEGSERVGRGVKFEVWRAFFMRFGMVEAELSESSWYQASLVAHSFPGGNSCTLELGGDGKNCLLVGWKGTPLFSLSIWKFAKQIQLILF